MLVNCNLGFNGAETNCGIAHILGILLMNSCNTVIFLATNNLQSVHFELKSIFLLFNFPKKFSIIGDICLMVYEGLRMVLTPQQNYVTV